MDLQLGYVLVGPLLPIFKAVDHYLETEWSEWAVASDAALQHLAEHAMLHALARVVVLVTDHISQPSNVSNSLLFPVLSF